MVGFVFVPRPSGVYGKQQKSPNERKAVLARQLQTLVVQGRRIESQGDYHAVVVQRRWLGLAERREMVTVDEWGVASVQRL
jgi:hypothetical protein